MAREIKDPASFILEAPLYAAVPCDLSEYSKDKLLGLFYSSLNFDGHCPYCRARTTFSRGSAVYLRNPNPPTSLPHKGWIQTRVACARNGDHTITVWLYLEETPSAIVKVGQFPALADIANDELRIYDRLLDPTDGAELHRAVGLAAHGIGVGSFAYLRRVFERLVRRTFDRHSAGQRWNEDDWSRRRVNERIQLLKPFLPDFLQDCPPLYGVLSKGLHELDEDECKICFPVLKAAILEILDDERRARDKEQKRKETQAALATLSTEISTNSKSI